MNEFSEELPYSLVNRFFESKTDLGGKPYVEHLERVATNAYFINIDDEKFDNRMISTIALLHDIIEDCSTEYPYMETLIHDVFGEDILEIIKILTRTKSPEFNYQQYIEDIGKNHIATIIKLADLQDNMQVHRLPKLQDKDIERLKKYHKSYQYLMKRLEEFNKLKEFSHTEKREARCKICDNELNIIMNSCGTSMTFGLIKCNHCGQKYAISSKNDNSLPDDIINDDSIIKL